MWAAKVFVLICRWTSFKRYPSPVMLIHQIGNGLMGIMPVPKASSSWWILLTSYSIYWCHVRAIAHFGTRHLMEWSNAIVVERALHIDIPMAIIDRTAITYCWNLLTAMGYINILSKIGPVQSVGWCGTRNSGEASQFATSSFQNCGICKAIFVERALHDIPMCTKDAAESCRTS